MTLEDWDGTTKYAEYSEFRLEDEEDKYRLRYGGFLGGEAGDALRGHNNQPFSTPDNDNDQVSAYHCAETYRSGWWFYRCFYANLNGPYQTSSSVGAGQRGIRWMAWSKYYSFKGASMMVRRSDP